MQALDGDDRPGQRTLAAAVDAAVTGGHHLVAEAPTGSGKSLAYLAPAIASGKRVVIATATLTLQDQLWQKDLPHLHEHGGVDFTAAVLKGRSQYVCHAKLERARTGDALFDERPGPSFDVDVARLVRFAASSDTGDFAGVDIADASPACRELRADGVPGRRRSAVTATSASPSAPASGRPRPTSSS